MMLTSLAVASRVNLASEGIVSKRLGSPYRSGRSRHWIKSKKPPSAHPLEPILLPAFDVSCHVWSWQIVLQNYFARRSAQD